MTSWPRYPTIYEINTRVWLFDLGEKTGHSVDLRSVPSPEWDCIAAYGFDAIWLMGVWQRSPASITVSNRNNRLFEEFEGALADLQPQDNIGSAYSVRDYIADQALGGSVGLAIARDELTKRGIRLILDFVPNHVALDHPWVAEHPEYFIEGNPDDAKNDPDSFVKLNGEIFACGRDPYFPAWRDVLQLNAFDRGFRQASIEAVASLAGQCDGVRCDMAMLLLNSIFERTWGTRAGQKPRTEFWADLIAAIKNNYPEFLFVAEAYWDREWELQQQGSAFVMTSDSTTVWRTAMPNVYEPIFVLLLIISQSSCASSKTTTSGALPLHSHFTGNARWRWLWQRCRAQDYFIRDNLQDERHGYLSFSGDAPRSR